MASKAISKGLNMIMFRGKLTCSPNTLNNEIHTYFFAHHWQKRYTQDQFDYRLLLNNAKYQALRLKTYNQKVSDIPWPKDKKEFSYENWMKLIKDVAQFNRFYVQCFKQAFGDEGKNITIMDFRAFRLFHDWDVWGDSTSYPEIKATAVFDASQNRPIKSIDDLHLSTKMGTNKCVIANMDTDSQDMSKLFAFSLNMNQQLKLHLNPSVTRTLYFRTVDTLPWTPSMGTHWFGTGNLDLLHGNINPQNIKWPLNILYNKAAGQNLTELKMLQYRYNHPTKVSSIVGYLMNTEGGSNNEYQYVNHNWRIVKISGKYNNPSPQKSYNGNTNDHTTAEVFVRNVSYGIDRKGILVDLSGAIMDANNFCFLPNFPHQFVLRIFDDSNKAKPLLAQFIANDQKMIADLFHNKAGLLLLQNAQIPAGKPIRIRITEILKSTVVGCETQIPAVFDGVEPQFNLEIKDHFMKTPVRKVVYNESDQLSPDGKSKSVTFYQKFVRYELNYTKYGEGVTGNFPLSIDSQFNIDSSGLTQYTSRQDYLKTKNLSDTPKQRLRKLIFKSNKFREVFPDIETIDQKVFQNKLDWIIKFTDQEIIDKLFKNGTLQYTFPDAKGNPVPFKLSFQPDQEVTTTNVELVNGRGHVDIFLNKSLTEEINPRHPSMESLCLTGQLKPAGVRGNFEANLTALFFQNPKNNPYVKVDWLHVVGPKLKLMGLLYPSMQNIIDLYDYDGLSMNAMKRAFEIEDEQHSRYMPATREMAPTTHRQIRRWLYNPVYDSKIYISGGIDPFKSKPLLPFKTFEEGKAQLIDLLRGAFKLELTTIPIYLSAMYSIKQEGEATKLIRSVAKDEMKHLFIASNLLNAVGENPPYPTPSTAQSENVPTFPVPSDKLLCFHFQLPQNKKWKDLMDPLPIQSSIKEQLLRFIMIEMPAQAYEIEINPDYTFLASDKSAKQIGKYWDLIQQRRARISELKEAIDAVKAEMAAKPQLQALRDKLQQNNQNEPKKDEFLTIGMAYQKIMDYLWVLNDMDQTKLFNGDNSKQFSYMYLQNMTNIINLRTALEQIRLITEEGEGSSIFTVTGDINKTSHFIKFIEIYTGCDLEIRSDYKVTKDIEKKQYKRTANFIFIPNSERFPNFPNYTNVEWNKNVDNLVDESVNSELTLERLSDNLRFTKFPNTYAPRSFLNNYVKILQQLGFIFTTDPKKFVSNQGLTFEQTRLRAMENTIAKMRQMSLNATHVVHPNDTFDRKFHSHTSEKRPNYPPEVTNPKRYPSASPKYNLEESRWLPQPKDEK